MFVRADIKILDDVLDKKNKIVINTAPFVLKSLNSFPGYTESFYTRF
jgi:hypothetical protein